MHSKASVADALFDLVHHRDGIAVRVRFDEQIVDASMLKLQQRQLGEVRREESETARSRRQMLRDGP
jgi:hypothetical protein